MPACHDEHSLFRGVHQTGSPPPDPFPAAGCSVWHCRCYPRAKFASLLYMAHTVPERKGCALQPTKFFLTAAALITLTVGMSAVASWAVTSATTSSIALAAVTAMHAKDGANGKDGTNGSNGSNGKDGPSGAGGIAGVSGAIGSQGADGTAGVNASRSAPIVSPALERFTQVFTQVELATIPTGVYAIGLTGKLSAASNPYEPTTCWLQLADGTSLSSVQVSRPNSSAGMSAVLVANGPTALYLTCGPVAVTTDGVVLTAVPLDH